MTCVVNLLSHEMGYMDMQGYVARHLALLLANSIISFTGDTNI